MVSTGCSRESLEVWGKVRKLERAPFGGTGHRRSQCHCTLVSLSQEAEALSSWEELAKLEASSAAGERQKQSPPPVEEAQHTPLAMFSVRAKIYCSWEMDRSKSHPPLGRDSETLWGPNVAPIESESLLALGEVQGSSVWCPDSASQGTQQGGAGTGAGVVNLEGTGRKCLAQCLKIVRGNYKYEKGARAYENTMV